MGTLHQFVREFRPDPAAFDELAQLVSSAYLTKLAVYGQRETPRLRYQMAFTTPDGHEASFTLEFDLNGTVLKTKVQVHMRDHARSQAASKRILQSVVSDVELKSVGDHIAFWQNALHELFHSGVCWDVWEYLILADDSIGWVQVVANDFRS